MRNKQIKSVLLLVTIFALPFMSGACPLCQAGGTKRTQKAYNQSTLLMALLPITGTGAILFWMRAKRKQMEKGN